VDYTILEHVPVSVFFLNQQNEIVFLNNEARAFENILGKSIEVGSDFLGLMPQRIQTGTKAMLQQAKSSKATTTLEWELVDKKGRTFCFETVCNPVAAPFSQMTCIVFKELTAEKVFQKKIVQMSHDFSSMVENANAVIFSIDSREYVTDWNAECARITQRTKEEALTKKIGSFVHSSVASQFDLYLKSIYAGNPVNTFELHFITEKEQVVNVLVNATPKINNEGKVIGILFVGHDITELSEYKTSLERVVRDRTQKLKEALDKEKELLEIKNRFVSMASHELRIPLSMISSSAQYVREKINDSESIEKIEVIEKQITHMRALIEDVLTLGKPELTKIKTVRNRIDVVDFIRKLSEEVAVNAQYSHKIVFTISKPVIEIESDDKLLRNIFLNILSNAIKFSPSQKEIYIAIAPIENSVEIKVTDHGIGIDEQDLIKVFEPFTRGSNVTQIKGSGLGLSIVKRAIELLDGTIHVASAVDRGTTMTVRFNYQG
jgi:PAS domain S-box-containing protein